MFGAAEVYNLYYNILIILLIFKYFSRSWDFHHTFHSFIKAFRPFVFLRTWDLLSDSGNAETGVNSRKTTRRASVDFVICRVFKGHYELHKNMRGVDVRPIWMG